MNEILHSLGEWLFILGVGSGLAMLALALLLALLCVLVETFSIFTAIPLGLFSFFRRH